MNRKPAKPSKKPDPAQLQKEHPNDPRIGQGFNDARGEIPEDQEHPTYKNIQNNLGPPQKRPRPGT